MKCYQLKTTQKLPIDINTAWDFLSNPANLKKITPPYMGFFIKTEVPRKMYSGLIINYIVTPVLNIPTAWTTEITFIDEPNYFVDEQRMGPYKMWHHEHHIKEIDGGVEMNDIISYILPLGPLGMIARELFVKNKLQEIFDFRYKALEDMFGKYEK